MPLLAPRVVIKGRLRWGDRSNERVTRGDRLGAPWWRHLGLLLSLTINLIITHNNYLIKVGHCVAGVVGCRLVVLVEAAINIFLLHKSVSM